MLGCWYPGLAVNQDPARSIRAAGAECYSGAWKGIGGLIPLAVRSIRTAGATVPYTNGQVNSPSSCTYEFESRWDHYMPLSSNGKDRCFSHSK